MSVERALGWGLAALCAVVALGFTITFGHAP